MTNEMVEPVAWVLQRISEGHPNFAPGDFSWMDIHQSKDSAPPDDANWRAVPLYLHPQPAQGGQGQQEQVVWTDRRALIEDYKIAEVQHIDFWAAKAVEMLEADERIISALESAVAFDLVAHLERQRAFSAKTFGPGARTKGVCDHIRKELNEIEDAPADLAEWIDVVMLGLDGAWRTGAASADIAQALAAKLATNEARIWPDWRTVDPNKAIEHDRTLESAQSQTPPKEQGCATCDGSGEVRVVPLDGHTGHQSEPCPECAKGRRREITDEDVEAAMDVREPRGARARGLPVTYELLRSIIRAVLEWYESTRAPQPHNEQDTP